MTDNQVTLGPWDVLADLVAAFESDEAGEADRKLAMEGARKILTAWNTRTQPAINSGGEAKGIAWKLRRDIDKHTKYSSSGRISMNVADIEEAIAALAAMDRAPGVESDLAACDRAIDRMGWPEIHAFMNEPAQSPQEDAGGYMLRKIKALFGIKSDRLETYKEAARRLIAEAQQNTQPAPRPVEAGEVEDLREALGLALIRLEVNEPKDSRAVSDEFVAMAAVHAGITDSRADCMKIIRARVSEAVGGGQS